MATTTITLTTSELRTCADLLRASATDLRQRAVIATTKGNQDEGRRLRAKAQEIATILLRFQP